MIMPVNEDLEKNILLITVDALRADHLSVYDSNEILTPNLDKLAKDGILFKNAFANANSTRPSLACLLTGSYPLMFGGWENGISGRTHLAEILKKIGYKTIGAHSNAWLSRYPIYGKGFEKFIDLSSNSNLTEKIINSPALYPLEPSNLPYTRAEKKNKYVKNTIQQHSSNKKVFLWIHYMDPHFPYLPPDTFLNGYQLDNIFQRFRTKFKYRNCMENKPSKKYKKEEKKEIKELYKGEVRYVDHSIGKLLDFINDEDWITFITSDHGEEFWDHGETSHRRKLYDELIRVPLIISGLDTNKIFDHLVSHIDIPTTILNLLNIEKPKKFFGGNLFDENKDSVICEGSKNKDSIYGYRSRKYKIIEDNIRNRVELYNLYKDPEERKNIAEKKSKLTIELLKKIQKHKNMEEKNNIQNILNNIKI